MATPPEKTGGSSSPGGVPLREVQGELDLFSVSLPVFEGPFDLLLQLITRRQLDITEVALSQVTDEFISFMRSSPHLSQVTEFLVVAATLLDMKAARLLPRSEDDEDLSGEDLEARDLLFSRLLQYRAFKEAGRDIGQRLEALSGFVAREVPLEAHFRALSPDLAWGITPQMLAQLAADALSRRPPTVQLTHLHEALVPVHEQVEVLRDHVKRLGVASFKELIADASSRSMVVSRFLAVLELYRRGEVNFEQKEALGELLICWDGGSAENKEEEQ